MATPIRVMTIDSILKRKDDLLVSADDIKKMAQQERKNAIEEFAHELKESLNRDIPLDYESTRPYFTLENARMIVDEVADQLIRNL